MTDAQFNFAVLGPLMFGGLGLAAYLVLVWLDRKSSRSA